MASFNRVILAGNLTRDPQLQYTSSNTPVCKFGLAVNRKWKDRNSGESKEEVCYVDCTAFGRSGEVINQYMNKGKPLLLEGRLHFSSWEAQDGGKRSKLEVVVENFQFLGAGPGGQGGGSSDGQGERSQAPAGAPPMADDNVPF